MSDYVVLLMGDADAWWDTSAEEKQEVRRKVTDEERAS